MIDRNKVGKTINELVVTYNSPDDKKKELNDFIDYLKQDFPKKLYKYRKCEENHLNSFIKDELWFSTSENMNDTYDGSFCFDKDFAVNFINKQISEESINLFYKNYIKSKLEVLEKLTLAGLKIDDVNCDDDNLYSNLISSIPKIREFFTNNVINIEKLFKKYASFICFCENVDSPVMWSQYSNLETGFALEYEFSNIIIDFGEPNDGSFFKSFIHSGLFPIYYSNEKIKISNDELFYIFNFFFFKSLFFNVFKEKKFIDMYIKENIKSSCPNYLLKFKLLLNKSIEWQHEKEWRIINLDRLNTEEQDNLAYTFPVKIIPSALFLGSKITEENKTKLVEIANTKKIPVFIMQSNGNNPDYKLVAKPIE